MLFFWSLTNWGCGLQNKIKRQHPAWLRKMPEKQSILFAWPNIKSILEDIIGQRSYGFRDRGRYLSLHVTVKIILSLILL